MNSNLNSNFGKYPGRFVDIKMMFIKVPSSQAFLEQEEQSFCDMKQLDFIIFDFQHWLISLKTLGPIIFEKLPCNGIYLEPEVQ